MEKLLKTSLTELSKQNKKIFYLLGPTASSKTKTSILIGKKHPIEIINTDAFSLYKGEGIMIAKATESEQKQVKHHLINLLEFEETKFSVFEFKSLFEEAVYKINCDNNIPLVVGGTNYYVEMVLFNYNSDVVKVDDINLFSYEKLLSEFEEKIDKDLVSDYNSFDYFFESHYYMEDEESTNIVKKKVAGRSKSKIKNQINEKQILDIKSNSVVTQEKINDVCDEEDYLLKIKEDVRNTKYIIKELMMTIISEINSIIKEMKNDNHKYDKNNYNDNTTISEVQVLSQINDFLDDFFQKRINKEVDYLLNNNINSINLTLFENKKIISYSKHIQRQILKLLDKESYLSLHPNDIRKIQNSIVYYFKNFSKKSDKDKENKLNKNKLNEFSIKLNNVYVIYLQPSKEEIQYKINKRLEQMLLCERGFEEIYLVFKKIIIEKKESVDFERGILQAIGYKEYYPLISKILTNNEIRNKFEKVLYSNNSDTIKKDIDSSLILNFFKDNELRKDYDDCLERLKISTFQYAKYQIKFIEKKIIPYINKDNLLVINPLVRLENENNEIKKDSLKGIKGENVSYSKDYLLEIDKFVEEKIKADTNLNNQNECSLGDKTIKLNESEFDLKKVINRLI